MKIMNSRGFRRVMIGTGLDMYMEGWASMANGPISARF